VTAAPETQEVFYLLDRSGQWQPLVWPLPEHRTGIQAGEWLHIDVLRNDDARALSGAEIWFGYGEGDEEMLAAGRAWPIYRFK